MIYPGFIERKKLNEAKKHLDELLEIRTALDKEIALAEKEVNTASENLKNTMPQLNFDTKERATDEYVVMWWDYYD